MKFRKGHCFGFGAASVAGLLFAAAPAWAGGDKAHGEHHKGMAGMEMMDTNGDGQLSREEHTAGARKMFETMDGDKDGKVTATEMEAAHAQIAGKDMKKMKGHMSAAEKIKVVDTSGDGVLTAEEHASGAMTMFDKMDTNKDGSLTKAEHASGHKAMMKKSKDAEKETTK
jgi:Ca2+-binding EF-hand superfamily protein